MDITTKNIQVFMYRILRFSMIACYKFIQRYPLFSGVLSIFFFLYLFLPSVFYFLIYSSPFLVSTAVYIRFYLSSKFPKIQNLIKDEKKEQETLSLKSRSPEDELVVSKNKKTSMRSQLSVRRNVGERYKKWDAQGGKEENDRLVSKSPDENESYGLDHGESSSCNVSDVENSQALEEHRSSIVSEPSMLDLVSYDASNEQPEKYSGDVGGEVNPESLEEAEDEDEEDAQEDQNKAVEWTEDDQKNLMDLGDSEIERNKRLESLILKRRARNLIKMQVEKSLIDMDSILPSQIAPIYIARSNHFGFPNNSSDIDALQMPGSAPSILLPGRNPFDLPYEPHEEKPDLMADSFQQEFTAAHQKDIFFCRHESFCRGPSFPLEPNQDQYYSELGSYFGFENKPRYSRFKRQPAKSELDQLGEESSRATEPTSYIEHPLTQGSEAWKVMNSEKSKHDNNRKTGNSMIEIIGEGMEGAFDMKSRPDNGNAVQMGTDSIKGKISGSSSLSCLKDGGHVCNAKTDAVSENVNPRVGTFPEELSNPVSSNPKSLAVNGPSYNFSSNETNMEELLFYTDKGASHNSSNSLASDMQVEVSEVGSPPTVSSPDGESLTYEGDVEKELTCGEEMWGASLKSRSRETNDVSEDDTVEGGFSGVKKKPEDTVRNNLSEDCVQDLFYHPANNSNSEKSEVFLYIKLFIKLKEINV
ncbi:hypothetical protein CFOL_v3_17951 [Cephalotus follicularis]|uniref:Uncharacterized protein n=1 Tax=Cephalotus follicularis TaxID=3775 RepID=A0A1Q3C2T0_CEPFO|nr:hypothetical protein CFOL_v3_17951 [Cephalotus follicularis]